MKFNPVIRLAGAAALVMMLCIPGTSFALSEEKSQDETLQLESVTVTARKKEEKVQDVPMSISVFSEMQLEDAQIENTFDLTRLTPNITMQNNIAEHVIVIRGVSSFSTSIFSPTGYYVDDVSYPLHYMHNAELFDVERVEVLKGPQGTLYGRNSESGVINVFTRQPDNQFRGKIFGEYAEYNTVRTGLSLSGPAIKDKLFFGLAVQSKTSDGYIENLASNDDDACDMDHKNGRATIRWTPSGRWDFSFVADMMETDDHSGYRAIDGSYYTPAHTLMDDTDDYSEQDGNGQTLRIKYKGDNYDFISVTGAQYYTHDYQNDADFWNSTSDQREYQLSYKDRQYSQEIRLSSPSGSGPFEWLVGAYGFKEKTRTDYAYNMVSYNMVYMNPVTDMDIAGYAAFGQATYTLFNRLHLTAGLRFDHQELDGHLVDSISGSDLSQSLDYDEFLPKASVSFDVTGNAMTYATVSKGYMVGGFNYCLRPVQDNFSYDPEYTLNYEVGLKTSWLNNRLNVNLAAFYIEIDDKQVSELNTANMLTIIDNAAEAHSQGLELELQARPMRGLDLFAGFGYTESKFDNFSSTVWNDSYTQLIEENYDGKYLSYAPKFTYNLGVQYRHESGFFGRVELFGTDEFYGNYANTAKQDAYQTVNLRLGYQAERYDVVLWCKNLFDEEYLTYVASSGSDYNVGVDGVPQIFGVTVTYRF